MYKLEKRIKLEKDDNIENADKKVLIRFLIKIKKKNIEYNLLLFNPVGLNDQLVVHFIFAKSGLAERS